MLDELALAAAAAGGSAVEQAAGTDVWNGFRGRVAEWFGRRDAVRESRELERLDRSASELTTAGQDEVERLRVRQEAVRQSRVKTLLEDLDRVERDQSVAELSELLAQARPQPGPADAGPAEESGNTFNDPAAFQIGGEQHVRFTSGSQPNLLRSHLIW
ncbi:hypothetical protein K7B10_06440 [Streptomyces flavotricini]|uniref:Uncharacterized protein n=1 Tax=Streptomyces flavotricini TaxID=66888 RepID=A0ABS8E1I8_9ACTN|nr:hypothetical protein [Streptomyces flavotricini]MCC0094432.1 hypothetical protein [Streptomyces flavotricini]